MKRFATAAIAALVVSSGGPAQAQTTAPAYVVFSTVDGVTADGYYLTVSGINAETGTTQSITLNFYDSTDRAAQLAVLEACQRHALLAMMKPGAFRFEVQPATASYDEPNCRVVRASP